MHVDKIIKKQTLTLLVIVITLIVFIFSVMYIMFFEIDNYSESKNDFEISFCIDKSCNSKYYNYNNLVGISNIDNKISLKEIKKYNNRLLALLEHPYVFNIKNNMSDSNIAIKLNFKKDYLEDEEYKKYINNVYVAVASDEDDLKIIKYNDIKDYLLSSIRIKHNEVKKYYIWLWIENNDYNKKIYFPCSVEVNVIK